MGPGSSVSLCGALCSGCLWQPLATWMGPWPSMTCLRRPSGTSVSTRYRQPGATAMAVGKAQSLGWLLHGPSLWPSPLPSTIGVGSR